MTDENLALREHLAKILSWHDAHADVDTAVDGIPAALRGTAPPGLPHSPLQLLAHLRITQHASLDFCVNPEYRELRWPDDYWPAATPPDEGAWDASVAAYRHDRDALARLVRDPATNLFARVPHGEGQTYLRELLLVADHAAYHTGQLVLVRRLLGVWPGGQ